MRYISTSCGLSQGTFARQWEAVDNHHSKLWRKYFHESEELHEKNEFSARISKQLELPIELTGSSVENPRDAMSPAFMGGISLAYQGFLTFLQEDDSILQIDRDKSDLPTF